MDKRQKSTLRSQHIRIADELILDEDFYAALRRDKIFTNGMLDLIKAEPKPRDRVYKMLELLEKRGPKAFENFVWILKENYEWLAKELEDQYNKRLMLSQQEKEIYDQRSVQYETQQNYFSQEHYNRVEQYCTDRAVPNPVQQQVLVIPAQESASAGYSNKDSSQYFPKPGYTPAMVQHNLPKQQQPNIGIDTTDNKIFNDTESEPKRKEYKDACMSPIGIIESPRKAVHKSDARKPETDKDETQSEAESYDQGFDEIQSQTATLTTSTNDDVESQITRTTEVGSVGFDTLCENTGTVDGPEDVTVGLDENDEDFPTSEVYYDCVRRGSSRFSYFENDAIHQELGMHDDSNDLSRSEVSYEHTEAFQIQTEAMRRIYVKLTGITSENEEMEDFGDNEVIWEMIDCETDRLINRLENSDDMKMIRKCYDLFPEKERKQPLNMCIERLLAEKKELDNKLRDKRTEIDQMVFDLWKHQQDMSNFKKMKKRLTEQDTELNNLKTSLENLEKDGELKLNQIEEKDRKIETLETKVKEMQGDQQRRPGMPSRRGMSNQRRTSNTQGQSPKRPSANFTEPRFSLMQGGYGNTQQSPRNVATAMRRVPNNKR